MLMADNLPEGTGWWFGAAGLVTAAAAGAKSVYDAVQKARAEKAAAQVGIDDAKAKRKQALEDAESKRKMVEKTDAIDQWRALTIRQDADIQRLTKQIEDMGKQMDAQQVAINDLYRLCSASEVDVTDLYAALTIMTGIATRQAACLKENKLPCEEVPSLPARPRRRNGADDPGYVVRVAKQNSLLMSAVTEMNKSSSGGGTELPRAPK